jgi:hypothetical protein
VRQFAFISFAIGFMGVGCSNEDIDLLSESGTVEGEGVEEGMGEELTPPPNNEGAERLSDPNAAPVLAERDGKFYQVYEVATISYTGKVVEYHPDSTEASEKIYDLGVLTRQTEWHDTGQKRMESIRQTNGVMKTTYYDKEGNPVKAPVRIGLPLGRSLEWKTGVGPASIEVLYRGKGVGIIRKAFGEPDEDQNGVWIYKGMKVAVAQTGQIMTTVRFTISNDQVLSISVEP